MFRFVPNLKISIQTFDYICFLFLFSCKKPEDRNTRIAEWHTQSGVLIMGYDMYRLMVADGSDRSNDQAFFKECLTNPGPDVIICDEGHLLKNDRTSLSDVVSNVRTKRRIVLSGTPLQNNLEEFYCMVNFVKPYLLGTPKEFANRFVNPIMNGQYKNSNDQDIKLMKRRSHVLYELLKSCIHRADLSVLESYLPRKEEYAIYIQLSSLQVTLYKVRKSIN